jgi:hypothetical protein
VAMRGHDVPPDDDERGSMQRNLEQYSIADFLDFRNAKRLHLNPDFQRRSIWKTPARVYLIDSILRDIPVPKLYFRTIIDPRTQSTVREVVDGQQRLRAIFDFADDKLVLTKRAQEFAGLTYSTLDEDLQQKFLGYTFAAEQLINANDEDVLEVFARINTYSISLVPAELRNATYQGDFKWAVYEAGQRWSVLWDDFGVLSLSERARMADDALLAQMFLLCSEGIVGGENSALNRAYSKLDKSFPELDRVREQVDEALAAITEHLSDALVGLSPRPPTSFWSSRRAPTR